MYSFTRAGDSYSVFKMIQYTLYLNNDKL